MSVFQNLEKEFFQSPVKVFDRVSDEELISDDEESFIFKAVKPQENRPYEFESKNQDGGSTWSTVFEETKDLMRLPDNDSSSSLHLANAVAKKTPKGSGGKAKHRFLFRFHSDKEKFSSVSMANGKDVKSSKVPQSPEGLEDFDCGLEEHSMAELLEVLEKAKGKKSESNQVSSVTSSIMHRNMEPMTNILEGVLQNNGQSKGTPQMSHRVKGKRLKVNAKGNISSLGCRSLDYGDPPEPLDSSTSSEEEAGNSPKVGDQNQLQLVTSTVEGQMMTDRFHKALDAAAVNDQGIPFATSKQTGGYFGRLQQVVQTEREVQLEFLKQLQSGRTRQGRILNFLIIF